jgi:hypothetical protein
MFGQESNSSIPKKQASLPHIGSMQPSYAPPLADGDEQSQLLNDNLSDRGSFYYQGSTSGSIM